nr:retrovirus-related Pol polyprotein from transposon TNT 1-94 [Tanacetum cinerariifolium]
MCSNEYGTSSSSEMESKTIREISTEFAIINEYSARVNKMKAAGEGDGVAAMGCGGDGDVDGEDLDKIKEKGDSCILVGYSTQTKGYRVYNKRTRFIVESIHIKFDEIKEMTETYANNNTSGNNKRCQIMTTLAPRPNYKMFHLQQIQQLRYNKSWIFFGPLYDEFFNASTSSVNKSSSPIDNSKQQDSPPITNIRSSTEQTTLTSNVNAVEENNDNQAADTQFQQDEFINHFCIQVREVVESSSYDINNSNMHTFYQPHDSEYRWTKDHPLEQVHGNPSELVQTKRQLTTNPEMCMFTLNVSTVEPKNIKDAMANSAWIEDCTIMSSAESEYMALSASCAQVMWMRTQLKDYGFNYNKILLYCDSQPAIAISCKPVKHSRTKNIHTRYHFIKEQVENGIIELYVVRTKYRLADMFTKPLPEDRFQYLIRRIEMNENPSRVNIKQLCGSLILAELNSLPHAYAQTTKTYYKHQDSKIKKAQELKTKTFAYSGIKDSSSETKLQERLLASFQDDAKYEHVGQDTRSQDGKGDNDKQGKDLKISKKRQSRKTMKKAQD